jgi:hypothetical protein
MIKVGTDAIQAFPITKRTYVGIASAYTNGGSVLHVAEDGQITFDFGTMGSVVVNAIAGQDFALAPDIEAITSTGIVWIN